jgi:NtrC-family two-component system response regulator AlgB
MPPAPESTLRILVVDDEPSIRRALAIALESTGNEVVAVGNPGDAVAETDRRGFDLAFVDLRLGTASGLDLIPRLLGSCASMRVVVITAFAGIDTAVEAMRRGAFDYLPKPFTPAQVEAVVRRVAEVRLLERRVSSLQDAAEREPVELESHSPAMRRAIDLARQVAPTEATVLLRGESGTGKGVLARAIHAWSPRRAKGMATVSSPSLSAELLESELFGHVKGAFTGALRDHPGRIESADGGTLFLDEIGDLPIALQPKLLRFLQDRQYERVGDSRTRRADVRLITATNIDLEAAVKAGTFREDLYYRLNVIPIDVPSLRARPEDIVPLAMHLLAALRRGPKPSGFTAGAQSALRAYPWPGNVRELRNVVERCTILCSAELVGTEHLPASLGGGDQLSDARPVELGDRVPFEKVEEAHIRRVLARTSSLEEAADVLEIDVATLWRKRRKYGI